MLRRWPPLAEGIAAGVVLAPVDHEREHTDDHQHVLFPSSQIWASRKANVLETTSAAVGSSIAAVIAPRSLQPQLRTRIQAAIGVAMTRAMPIWNSSDAGSASPGSTRPDNANLHHRKGGHTHEHGEPHLGEVKDE